MVVKVRVYGKRQWVTRPPTNVWIDYPLKGYAEIKISNPNSYDLNDYQVRVDLTDVINTYGKSKIIIYDDSGNIIPFAYEKSNGEVTPNYSEWDTNYVWVKVPNIPANGEISIYLAYALTDHATTGDEVFDFYDDFNNGIVDTNKWETYTVNGSIVEENGHLKLSITTTAGESIARVLSKQSFSLPLIVEMRFKMDGSDMDTGRHNALFWYDSNNYLRGGFDIAATDNPGQYWHIIVIVSGSSSWNEVYDAQYDPDANWISVKVIFKQDRGLIYKLDDGTKLEEATFNFPYATGKVGLQHWYSASSTYTDWIRVRKYADQEPTVSLIL